MLQHAQSLPAQSKVKEWGEGQVGVQRLHGGGGGGEEDARGR